MILHNLMVLYLGRLIYTSLGMGSPQEKVKEKERR